MTDFEAFVLHMRSMFMDALNNETGLLRCLAEDLDPQGGMGHLKPLADRLRGMANELQKKLARVKNDIEEFVGCGARLNALLQEDFDAGFKLSAYQWLDDDNPRKSSLRTCQVCACGLDGTCNEVQAPWTAEISNKGSCEKWRLKE